ncbi:MAG: hypothetical protein WDM88_10000 [Galbitalea sp.]
MAGALLASSLAIACAGCSATPGAATGSPAPATATPHFQATWLPVRTYSAAPPVAQTLKWQGPNGTTGTAPIAEVLQLQSQQPSTMINMVVVSAAAYPPGYWQSFASSTTWQHFAQAGRPVAVNPPHSGSSTVAIREDRGYIIQLTTQGISERDTLRIMQGIRWK